MSKRPHLAAACAAIGLLFSTSALQAQEVTTPAVTTQTQARPLAAPEAGAAGSGEAQAPTPATAQQASPTTTDAPTAAPAPAAGTTPSGDADAAAEETEFAEALEERQSSLPHDLSPWGMFMAADIVVKGVMIGLALASVATWTVLIAKIFELGAAQRAATRAVRHLTDAKGLAAAEELFSGKRNVPARMVAAARQEVDNSDAVLDFVSDGGVKERVASRLQRSEVQAGRQIAKGTGLLATIGSTAPFVGLFGTVWGIMNSFIGISQAQTTNLAIVAPGIAEALLATAIGLVAAIPAVVFYNFLARAITGYRQALTDTSAAIERLVSRDLDVRRARLASQRGARQDSTLVRIG
ncbi:outer membrane transport energization protein ExbB [Rhizobium subbaraonis]|uniref:Biopolymer transport protein ExbB n=1 Tax=Rhizobium subbaraonis TaxID=908946 RepID=A0A285U9S0_9HYPH|nr:tonB-system energizer ExbB [Rhizobium subbaraonis]SOC38158.1 outer membrane transport energization protein ExbB [Rhizobium subbaraonis]